MSRPAIGGGRRTRSFRHPEIKQLIGRKADLGGAAGFRLPPGLRTLREAAVRKLAEGETTSKRAADDYRFPTVLIVSGRPSTNSHEGP